MNHEISAPQPGLYIIADHRSSGLLLTLLRYRELLRQLIIREVKLRYQRSALGFSRKELEKRFDRIVRFAELEEFIDVPLMNYSVGMSARLGFAIATDVEPDLLLIDELFSVGDAPPSRRNVRSGWDRSRRTG